MKMATFVELEFKTPREEFELESKACTQSEETEIASLIFSFNGEGIGKVVSKCHFPDQVQTTAKWARVLSVLWVTVMS